MKITILGLLFRGRGWDWHSICRTIQFVSTTGFLVMKQIFFKPKQMFQSDVLYFCNSSPEQHFCEKVPDHICLNSIAGPDWNKPGYPDEKGDQEAVKKLFDPGQAMDF